MFNNACNIELSDIITGEKFVGACDYSFYHYEYNNRFTVSQGGKSFYCDTYVVEQLFAKVPKDHPIVIVTHNADRNVTESLYNSCMIDNCVAWFSQNPVCTKDKLHPIPIGLENERWFPEVKKKEKILQKRRENKFPEKMLYLNCAIVNNPTVRNEPYNVLGSKPWVTTKYGCNGSNFDEYLEDINNHFYILSPEGNGVDCHRTWEALYSNRVPVLKRNHYTSMYEDLPVLLVDSWSELTDSFLEERKDFFLNADFNFEKLKFEYWKNRILSSCKN